MKTGMSRFTKGCLVTAMVTFIVGCLLCGVGALFGGFGLLRGTDIEGITGIPFRVYQHDGGGIEFGFMNYGWDDGVDWSDYEKWNRVGRNDGEIQLDLTADTLRNLYIELGACELHIAPSKYEQVGIEVKGTTKYFRYLVENGDTLRLTHRTGRGVWNWADHSITTDTKVYLYLPDGTMPDYMEIEIGAGSMESTALQAREADLDVGAGICNIADLAVAEKIDLSVGAGRITLDSLEAGELDIDVGAGELQVNGGCIERDADINLGMGNAELCELIRGNMNLECGMGNVTLRLDDAEADHNYEIECAMGNVRVGSRSYTGLADEVSISNGSRSTYDIECSMGNVNLYFAQ